MQFVKKELGHWKLNLTKDFKSSDLQRNVGGRRLGSRHTLQERGHGGCNAFDATTWYRSYYTISPTLNPDKLLITSWSIAPVFCGNPAPKWKIKPRVWSKRAKRFPITEPIPARSRFWLNYDWISRMSAMNGILIVLNRQTLDWANNLNSDWCFDF